MSTDVSHLRTWLNNLKPDPIDPDDPRYVPLEKAGRRAVDSIFSLIDLRLETTTQLLSGPNGSGKTTELRGLQRRLEEVGLPWSWSTSWATSASRPRSTPPIS